MTEKTGKARTQNGKLEIPDQVTIPFIRGDGIGIAPGGNINNETGHAVFEATHGTAPKYSGQDKVNPGSVVLSGEMMLRYMGWEEAADRIIRALEHTIEEKIVT